MKLIMIIGLLYLILNMIRLLNIQKKESDQEKLELALLVKSIYHKTFHAVDTVKFAKLLSTSRNDTLKSYAKWWKEYYSNVNYAVPEFLNRFNIKHSSLFTSETSDLRDSLKIIYKETPIVRVLIQDRYINLVLDTGSPWTILRQDVFDKFNLEKIESVLIPLTNTKATKVETFNAVLPSIKFDKNIIE